MPDFAQFLNVWQLEFVSANSISEITHREIPTFCNAIERLLYQFFRGNLFRYTFGD